MDKLEMLKNYEPILPTPLECLNMSLDWYKTLAPHLLEKWPAEFHELSVCTKFIQVDAKKMASWADGLELDYMDEVRGKLAPYFDGESEYFVKLSSRSPKDWSDNLITSSSYDALDSLAGSMRVFDDLVRYSHLKAPCFICLREPIKDIAPNSEYRVFVVDGDIRAISFYNYNLEDISPPVEREVEIRTAIHDWYSSLMKPHISVSDFVFDIHISEGSGSLKFVLIETNPFGLSDPCFLQSYENILNSDGQIAFNFPVKEQ